MQVVRDSIVAVMIARQVELVQGELKNRWSLKCVQAMQQGGMLSVRTA